MGSPPPASPAASTLPTPPSFSGTLSASAVDLATRSGTWPATQEILEAAVNRLNQKCLAAQGFDYSDIPKASLPSPEDEAAAIDLPGRKSRGYGLAPDTGPETRNPSSDPPPDPFYARLSPEERQRFDIALFGPPGKVVTLDAGGGLSVTVKQLGCEADSRRTLMGDVALWARVSYVTEQLNNRLADQVSTSPPYFSAVATWESCMARQGYEYETPEDAWQSMRTQYQQVGSVATFRQREIAVAVADGECAGQAHLPSTALQVRRDLIASLSESDRRTLADLAFFRDFAVKRAAQVLDNH